MKKIGVLLILLVIIPICFAQSKIVIEDVTENFQEAEVLVQSSGVKDKNYVYGNGLVVSVEGDGIRYHHQDILSSNRVITDQNGNIVFEGNYLPFGLIFSKQVKVSMDSVIES